MGSNLSKKFNRRTGQDKERAYHGKEEPRISNVKQHHTNHDFVSRGNIHGVSAFRFSIPRPQIYLPWDRQLMCSRDYQARPYTNGNTPKRQIKHPRINNIQFNIPRPQIGLPLDKQPSRQVHPRRSFRLKRLKRDGVRKRDIGQLQHHNVLAAKFKIQRPQIHAQLPMYNRSSKRFQFSRHCRPYYTEGKDMNNFQLHNKLPNPEQRRPMLTHVPDAAESNQRTNNVLHPRHDEQSIPSYNLSKDGEHHEPVNINPKSDLPEITALKIAQPVVSSFQIKKSRQQNADVKIYTYRQDSPLMVLSKKSCVKEVLNDLRNILNEDKSSSITLFHGDKELQETKDFEFAIRSTPYPVRLDVVCHPDKRVPKNRFRRFGLEDMIDGDLTDDRTIMVQMSCGHATTPQNLFDYCLSEIRNTRAEVCCPLANCKKVWNFTEILSRACLSDSERHLFERRLTHNFLFLQNNVFGCPSCGLMIDNSSDCNKSYFQCCYCKSGKYCRTCRLPMTGFACKNIHCYNQTKEINEFLAKCRRKTIIGVPECPVIRACPVCCKFIEYEGDLCKHMDCPLCGCRFCFICLSVKTGDYWTCGGAFERCSVATVQQV